MVVCRSYDFPSRRGNGNITDYELIPIFQIHIKFKSNTIESAVLGRHKYALHNKEN